MVGVPGVEFHVVPEVDGDAPVGLTQVVEPQTRQVQHVPRPHPDVEWVGVLKFCKLGIGIKTHTDMQEKANGRLREEAGMQMQMYVLKQTLMAPACIKPISDA